MKKLFFLLATTAMVCFSCGEDTEKYPSCYEAVSNLLDNGCVYTDGYGNPLDFNQTLAVCREMTAYAPKSCEDEVRDLLKCLMRIGSGETCTSCNDEMDRLFYCD